MSPGCCALKSNNEGRQVVFVCAPWPRMAAPEIASIVRNEQRQDLSNSLLTASASGPRVRSRSADTYATFVAAGCHTAGQFDRRSMSSSEPTPRPPARSYSGRQILRWPVCRRYALQQGWYRTTALYTMSLAGIRSGGSWWDLPAPLLPVLPADLCGCDRAPNPVMSERAQFYASPELWLSASSAVSLPLPRCHTKAPTQLVRKSQQLGARGLLEELCGITVKLAAPPRSAPAAVNSDCPLLKRLMASASARGEGPRRCTTALPIPVMH
jgi:hypothetical protein